MVMSELLLNVTGVSKYFPGVQALDNVSLDIGHGEAHGLLGENGAGKSTLIKILSGAYKPDSGAIELDGQPIHPTSPHDAQTLGIVTIYQEFNLVPTLTIAENVFMGREPGEVGFVNWAKLRDCAAELTTKLGL